MNDAAQECFPKAYYCKDNTSRSFLSVYLLFKPHMHVAVELRLRMKVLCERYEGKKRWQRQGHRLLHVPSGLLKSREAAEGEEESFA